MSTLQEVYITKGNDAKAMRHYLNKISVIRELNIV